MCCAWIWCFPCFFLNKDSEALHAYLADLDGKIWDRGNEFHQKLYDFRIRDIQLDNNDLYPIVFLALDGCWIKLIIGNQHLRTNHHVTRVNLVTKAIFEVKDNAYAFFDDNNDKFYIITYNKDGYSIAYSLKEDIVSYENYDIINNLDITKIEDLTLPFADKTEIISMDFINKTPYVYYKVKNLATGKYNYGIIYLLTQQIIFNTDQEITNFEPLSNYEMLIFSNGDAYKICLFRNGDSCKDSCPTGTSLVLNVTGNRCKSFSSSQCDLKLVPENICIDSCDTDIYKLSDDDKSCGLCEYFNSSKPYKLIKTQVCLDYLPNGTKFYNEKYELLECASGYHFDTINKKCIPHSLIPTTIPTTITKIIQTTIPTTIENITYINDILILIINNYKTITYIINKKNEAQMYQEFPDFPMNNSFSKFASLKYLKNNKINGTSIDLGICENLLREAYNFFDDEDLYILIIDIKEEGMKIPKIEYAVYYLNNTNGKLIQLDLSICLDKKRHLLNFQKKTKMNLRLLNDNNDNSAKIKALIPVEINNNIDKHNSSSEYYNNPCYTTTSQYGTDICLKDRRDEFIDNNMTLCEENCDLIGYDYYYNKSICSCTIKIKLPLLNEVKFDKERLKNNFIDINNIMNIKFLKCYKIAFKKENIIHNLGFYILGLNKIEFLITSHKTKKLKTNDLNDTNKKKPEEIRKKKKNKNKNKKNKIKVQKINLKEGMSDIIPIRKNDEIIPYNPNINYNLNNRKNKDKYNNDNKTKENSLLDYNDSELNSLPYKDALDQDKRTYIQYYISLLKTNHLLIFSFYPFNDYNSQIIKIFLFFFYFSSDLVINALFFTEATMNKIYYDKGVFDFVYNIPQIIYSLLISIIINAIIKYLSLSEKKVIASKEVIRNNSKDLNKNIEKLFKSLKIKFSLFFVITFIILITYWYYITCFCAIYKNTQIYLIKDTVSSFIMSLLTPFIMSFIPGIFRRFALKAKKMNRNIVYKFSQLLENL